MRGGVLVALVACNGADPPPAPASARGAELYAEMCALCHGDDGEGYTADAANALSNQQFLAIADDAFLRGGVERGRPGTPMSAWGTSRGGPLTDADLDALVAFMRDWQTAPAVDLGQEDVAPGEAMRGEAVYDVYCLECHGERGAGGDFMSIANPEFLASASDAYLHHVIARGRSGTEMIGYQNDLTAQNVDDLVALIRSWQEPVDALPCDPPSDDLVGALLNPGGDPPDFPSGHYVATADLFAAYDTGARMYIVDARPPCDYVAGHIAGAVSMPFYRASELAGQLPQDEWIIAYCACPHAEADAAADALEAAGHTLVKVLDEGLPGWEAPGHPLASGPDP